jgi:4,5-DOPA dioxygenase extradiol
MERKQFLHVLAGAGLMMTLQGFNKFTSELAAGEALMPVLFVGHGSPMNAIEDNEFSRRWKQMAKEVPVPKAVVIVSAHWLTRGTHVTAMEHPKTIHDFGGFPKALFDAEYPAPGDPKLASETASLIKSTNVGQDHDWGLDHGAWSVVKQMYPEATIPMIQLSIDYNQPPQYHYDLAKQLADLRKKGVLILASGNMVHNLGMIQFPQNANGDPFTTEFGFDWTHELNTIFKEKITNGDHKALINYEQLHKAAKLAVPTPDHYYPLLYALALQGKNDKVSFFNDKAVGGSLTMTSVKFG